MLEYIIDGHKYNLSYNELRNEYIRFCYMADKEFKKNLPAALHLACVICWLKETPSTYCLGDRGIIHELAHELHIGRDNTNTFQELRDLFKQTLKLE